MRRWLGLAVVSLGLGASTWAAAQPAADAVTRGRRLAELACTPCHVVEKGSDSQPILRNPGPTFEMIAARPSTTPESLRALLASGHARLGTEGRMPNPMLADYQIDELIAYILSLRG